MGKENNENKDSKSYIILKDGKVDKSKMQDQSDIFKNNPNFPKKLKIKEILNEETIEYNLEVSDKESFMKTAQMRNIEKEKISKLNEAFTLINQIMDLYNLKIINRLQTYLRLKFIAKIINDNRVGDFNLKNNRISIYNEINKKFIELGYNKHNFKLIYERRK